ncbi:MAG: ATP-binding cassette domain-containing protein, partial [Clostridiales bacterium]|nr:ATP-binding cassette domain-containing protein [Clostridiales bacterium]
MIKLLNLKKIYSPSKGAKVTALDSVNLELPERGMIFLLGKSGSGKSTLLNLIGGLDSISGGEIVVKGKSCKDFKTDDFDSYRNTYVGFVFQEFHILESYTIGQNVSLASELQNKKSDPDAVKTILKRVGLEDYYDRKPTELSGGQKQRVAIARALIKNPDVILADEPTGALDSATGKQVFEVLKSLSAEKLVVVVSHDRENAERYADRIIELKDGKIIDDRARKAASEKGPSSYTFSHRASLIAPPADNAFSPHTSLAAPSAKTNEKPFTVLDSCTIRLKKGARLSPADLDELNYLLFKAAADEARFGVRPAETSEKPTSERTAEREPELAAPNPDFEKTQYTDKTFYSDGSFKLIKSKLPVKIGIGLGLSNLKYKKIRLAFTIFLTFVSLVMFGFFDVLASYDYIGAELKTSYNLGASAVRVYKGSENSDRNNLSRQDTALLRDKTGMNVYSASPYRFNIQNPYSSNSYNTAVNSYDYFNEYQLIELEEDDFAALGLRFASLNSRMPTAYNEVLIPLWIAQYYIGKEMPIFEIDVGRPSDGGNMGMPSSYTTANSTKRIQHIDDFVGLLLPTYLNSGTAFGAKITGVVTTVDLDKMNGIFSVPLLDGLVSSDFVGSIGACFFAKKDLFTKSNSFSTYRTRYQNTDKSSLSITEQLLFQIDDTDRGWSNQQHFELIPNPSDRVLSLYTASSFSGKLEKNEIIVGYQILINFLSNQNDSSYYYSLTHEELFDYYIEHYGDSVELIKQIISNYYDWNDDTNNKSTTEIDALDTYHIVGIPLGASWDENSYAVYLSDEDHENLRITYAVNDVSATFLCLTGDLKTDTKTLKTLSEFTFLESFPIYGEPQNERFAPQSVVFGITNTIHELTMLAKQNICWISIILMFFSGLLLVNFIGTSIANKKKEIGILRAIGARNSDVFKIFFTESVFIGTVIWILSVLTIGILCGLFNSLVNILNFGIRQIALLAALSLFISFIGTFFPVLRFARKKP